MSNGKLRCPPLSWNRTRAGWRSQLTFRLHSGDRAAPPGAKRSGLSTVKVRGPSAGRNSKMTSSRQPEKKNSLFDRFEELWSSSKFA